MLYSSVRNSLASFVLIAWSFVLIAWLSVKMLLLVASVVLAVDESSPM